MILGERIYVRGTIECDEDLIVRGRCEGEVRASGTLTIEADAFVGADIEARAVIIYGSVHGQVRAHERIELTRTARVAGDVTAPTVTIAAGASFLGRVEMGDTTRLALPPPAPLAWERRALPREADLPNQPSKQLVNPLQADPAPMGSSPHPVVTPADPQRPAPPIARPQSGPLRRRS